MAGFWAKLSPWLDLPMSRSHWRLLCLMSLASTPMGLGAGLLARHRLDARDAADTQRPTPPQQMDREGAIAATNSEAASTPTAVDTLQLQVLGSAGPPAFSIGTTGNSTSTPHRRRLRFLGLF